MTTEYKGYSITYQEFRGEWGVSGEGLSDLHFPQLRDAKEKIDTYLKKQDRKKFTREKVFLKNGHGTGLIEREITSFRGKGRYDPTYCYRVSDGSSSSDIGCSSIVPITEETIKLRAELDSISSQIQPLQKRREEIMKSIPTLDSTKHYEQYM